MTPRKRVNARQGVPILLLSLALTAAACVPIAPPAPEGEAAPAAAEATAAPAAATTSQEAPATAAAGATAQTEVPAPLDADDTALLEECRQKAAAQAWLDAISACRRFADKYPDRVEPHQRLMLSYMHLLSYRDGLAQAEKVVALAPDDAVAWYYAGWAHRELGDYDEAVTALRKAVELDPSRAEYYRGLGVARIDQQDYGRGLAALERATMLAPGDNETRQLLEAKRVEIQEKLARFEKMVRDKPDDPASHAMLASAYQRYGFAEQALAKYDAALTKIPEDVRTAPPDQQQLAAQIWFNKGTINQQLGRYDAAMPAYSKAMGIEPDVAGQAWYNIGVIQLDLKNPTAAIEALRKSVELDTDVFANRDALARAYVAAGDARNAAEQRAAADAIKAKQDKERAALAVE